MTDDIVVGIDLGTTNTCVAYYINGDLKMVENADGKYVTPSYVYFNEKDASIVGDLARRLSAIKPEHGLYEMKRFIGREFHEIETRQDVSKLAFVLKNLENEPQVFLEKLSLYQSPVQVCALILAKMRKDICEKLGKAITRAVITVPAHFNVSQRKATLESAKRSGFKVLKLLNEPTAAALNYFHEFQKESSKYHLVYDLGGGTFDVAILERNESNIDIVCICGDSYLGGHDFDDIIVKYVLHELRSKYGITAKLDKRELRRLKNESEKAKETLSSSDETSIIFEGFLGQEFMEINLTRVHFEKIALPLIQRTIDVVDQCIKNSSLRKSDIEEIILAGGSTRMLKIQEILVDYFNGKSLIKVLNPDECVAKGAALQAAMLSKNPRQTVKHFRIKEVTSSSLGVADVTQKMDFIIKKDTPIPTCKSVTHATVIDQQEAIYLQIYEGEKWDVNKNKHLGELRITDLSPAPPGQCSIRITMNIDENGILTVTAKERNKESVRELQIAIVKDKVSRDTYSNNGDDEESFVEFARMKQFLIVYCAAILHNFDKKSLREAHRSVYDKCAQIQNQIGDMVLKDKVTLEKLVEETTNECDPLIERYSITGMPNGLNEFGKFCCDDGSDAYNKNELNKGNKIAYGNRRVYDN